MPATIHAVGAETQPVAGAPQVADLSVVVPTMNEHDNIEPLLDRLRVVLHGIAWEVIFVDDDSRDGTAARITELARADARVRCVRRLDRRGLSSACIEGILTSTAPFVAVMDADLQHDETLLPAMLDLLQTEPLDLVVGSRHVAGGGTQGLGRARARISRLAARLSRLVLRADVADPMSGFFMARREALEEALPRLSSIGFKILVDLFASSPRPLRFKELPYQFRARQHGLSKLDSRIIWEYLMLLADKLVGHVLPVRFLLFCLVGTLGLVVHLAVLDAGLKLLGLEFTAAQTLATVIAMIGNFTLNNTFTYRDRRLRGTRFIVGLLTFCLVCSVGSVANVGIASVLFAADRTWWLAGAAGALVGALWNYTLSSVITWRRPQ